MLGPHLADIPALFDSLQLLISPQASRQLSSLKILVLDALKQIPRLTAELKDFKTKQKSQNQHYKKHLKQISKHDEQIVQRERKKDHDFEVLKNNYDKLLKKKTEIHISSQSSHAAVQCQFLSLQERSKLEEQITFLEDKLHRLEKHFQTSRIEARQYILLIEQLYLALEERQDDEAVAQNNNHPPQHNTYDDDLLKAIQLEYEQSTIAAESFNQEEYQPLEWIYLQEKQDQSLEYSSEQCSEYWSEVEDSMESNPENTDNKEDDTPNPDVKQSVILATWSVLKSYFQQ